jgi:ASC-1-like (ASCH) protein
MRMHEFGIDESYVKSIIAGDKTIEVRLGKPKFLSMHTGDTVSVRMDIYKDGKLADSIHGAAQIRITQILYFETFTELLEAVDHTAVIPSAQTPEEALEAIRAFYSQADEKEFGVVAFMLEVI